jgi:hypothetical protein
VEVEEVAVEGSVVEAVVEDQEAHRQHPCFCPMP